MFLFDELTFIMVSQPIELPHGIFVVSAYERHESLLVMADYVDALQVGFITHTSLDWQKQISAELGRKVTFLTRTPRRHAGLDQPPRTEKLCIASCSPRPRRLSLGRVPRPLGDRPGPARRQARGGSLQRPTATARANLKQLRKDKQRSVTPPQPSSSQWARASRRS